MANEQLSGNLSALLNDKIINEAFDIARSNRTGILQTVSFGTPRTPYDGYKMSWLDMRVDATSSPTTGAVLVGADDPALAAALPKPLRHGDSVGLGLRDAATFHIVCAGPVVALDEDPILA